MDLVVSIIVPIYNVADYLAECLDSLVSQTYRNIEIILVDDGSTDSSPQICDFYASRDERIKVVHKINNGVSAARNTGIELAQGDYIMFVDGDDYLSIDMCKSMVDSCIEHNADFVICGNFTISTIGINSRKIFPASLFFNGESYTNDIQIATLGLVGDKLNDPSKLDRLTPVWARLYKTSIIKEHQVRFIDLAKLPSECLQFNFEFCNFAHNMAYVDSPLYYYRRNTQMSLTKPFRDDLWGKWLWWIDYMRAYLTVNKKSDKYWQAFYSRICCSVIPLGGNILKKPRYGERIIEAGKLLSNPELQNAFEYFDYSSMPFYWQMFFYCAKKRKIRMYLVITWCMRKILALRKS